jgi:transcriptional regulator with XRE-family HTH domain
MQNEDHNVERRALESARAFGSLIRSRRRALNMHQEQLALVTGVGRTFLIDLEAGKPSCQIGRSLLVAEALGFKLTNILTADPVVTDLNPPEMPAEEDDLDAPSPSIL